MRLFLISTALTCALFPLVSAPVKAISTLQIEGVVYAEADYIEGKWGDHVEMKGGAPVVIWTDPKTKDKITVRSLSMSGFWVKPKKGAKPGPAALDRIVLQGAGSSITSAQRGFTITASEITIVAAKTPGQSLIESAFAKGNVRLTQTQGNITGDATADTLKVKDGGDTAILTGNAVVNYKDPVYTGKATGDVITITEILPRNGQPSSPMIRQESKGNQSALSAKPAEAGK